MLPQQLHTRLAPTPSGLLHPGNGLSFLLTWAITKIEKGRLLLRIDDLDRARYRRAYVEDIFETLEWLGITYDDGPSGVEDFEQNWSQHQRLDLYHTALQELRDKAQVFACSCSRKDIRAINPDGHYPNTCLHRNLSLDEQGVAWRIQPPDSNLALQWKRWRAQDDITVTSALDAFVVLQKNGFPAYQLASLVDDAHFGINFIVRGQDLWASTQAQHYLAKLLSKTSFQDATFWHHQLLLGTNGEKLSKSKGAGSLKEWRESGRSPAPLFRLAEEILGKDYYSF